MHQFSVILDYAVRRRMRENLKPLVLVPLLALSASWATQVHGENLYNINNFSSSNVVQAVNATPPTVGGFRFVVSPGYQLSFSSIGVWVSDLVYNSANTNPTIRSSIVLTNVTTNTQILNQPLITTIPAYQCSLANWSTNGGFCERSLGETYTLLGSNTYEMTASYQYNLNNQNLYYLSGLTNDSQVAFIANSQFSEFAPTTLSPAANAGVFGPNLMSVSVAPIPQPSLPVPAPLPLMGAAATFMQARKIRRHCLGVNKA